MDEFIFRLRQIKKSTWLFSLLTAGSLIFSLYRLTGKQNGTATYDYFVADSLFTKWEKGEESLSPLENLLMRKNELHAKFDTKIAQHLLSMGQAGTAEAYVQNVQARQESTDSLAAQFSSTSVLIEKGEYEKALESSAQFNEKLESLDLPLLKLCNLVRMGLLESKVGNTKGELAVWEKVLQNEHFPVLEQTIHSDGLSYKDYLAARCKLINSNSSIESQN